MEKFLKTDSLAKKGDTMLKDPKEKDPTLDSLLSSRLPTLDFEVITKNADRLMKLSQLPPEVLVRHKDKIIKIILRTLVTTATDTIRRKGREKLTTTLSELYVPERLVGDISAELRNHYDIRIYNEKKGVHSNNKIIEYARDDILETAGNISHKIENRMLDDVCRTLAVYVALKLNFEEADNLVENDLGVEELFNRDFNVYSVFAAGAEGMTRFFDSDFYNEIKDSNAAPLVKIDFDDSLIGLN